MNIPKSYEALAADLSSEKILSKTLIGQKEAHMMLADRGRLDLATWKQKACEAAEREAALLVKLDEWLASHVKVSGENAALQQRLTVAEQRAVVLTEALEGMVEYFPEGNSDGECFSVERANLALGRPNDCIHDWFPDHCLKCGVTKP